ncbi:MAG: translation elongation factor Ts [Sphaerochaeta sp.]|nr:translation elongation factor Ts [Sphaerochaeta sp.]MDD4300854.1 translation elongation factor Ts [Sphaerochaeta sp.]MDD4646610.1 translation elongation factor Ts [Sphaerochaeta sp.]MDY0243592.1 translation elongation factor Ts [Sphaerochaeta sp.]
MAITAEVVKKLRDITGAGMMDCKKALTQSNGDFAAAEKILKEMGLAAVAKRQDRATNNGRVFVKVGKDKAVMVELSCETDFVASNDQFDELGNNICAVALEKGYSEINEELEGMVTDLITIIKENMALKQLHVFDIGENEFASTYVHGNGALAVLVMFKSDDKKIFENDLVKEFANDCALHVAAFTPSYLNTDAVDADYIKEQTEIFTAQAEKLGKPAKVIEGIVKGKLNKHLSEICFLQQPFVKDDSMSVEKKANEVGKAAGASLEIVNYAFLRAGAASCSV